MKNLINNKKNQQNSAPKRGKLTEKQPYPSVTRRRSLANFNRTQKSSWFKLSHPILWIVIAFSVILAGIAIYYFLRPTYVNVTSIPSSTNSSLVKPDNSASFNTESEGLVLSPEERLILDADKADNEPPADDQVKTEIKANKKSSLHIPTDIKEYSLTDLKDLASVTTKVNWFKVLKMIKQHSGYLIYDKDQSKWIVATDQAGLDKILSIIKSTSIVNGYFLVFGDYKNSDIFRVKQIINRISSQGYSAHYSKKGRHNLQIMVGHFPSTKLAWQAGEKIYQFFKNANIFSANFYVKKTILNQNRLEEYKDIFVIDFKSFDSLELAYGFYYDLTQSFDEVVYLTKSAGVYDINIGFFKSKNQVDNILQARGVSIPPASAMLVDRMLFK
ncbi:MAG: hypothetical protein JJV97_04740 [SAR324 cluster bacterium]|nr:hypothetical protein [SAR324 cluster bacterium]